MILEILVGAATWSPPRRSLDAETVLFGSGKLPERLPYPSLTDVFEGPAFIDNPWEVPVDLAVASEEADGIQPPRGLVNRRGVTAGDPRVRPARRADDTGNHLPSRRLFALAHRSRLGTIDAFAGVGQRGRGAAHEGDRSEEDARKGGEDDVGHEGLLLVMGRPSPVSMCATDYP